MQNAFRIRFSAQSQRSVSSEILVHDSDLIPIRIVVVYKLASGAKWLVGQWTRWMSILSHGRRQLAGLDHGVKLKFVK